VVGEEFQRKGAKKEGEISEEGEKSGTSPVFEANLF
jgi:hypothetical protein